jgi:hypothetical protein
MVTTKTYGQSQYSMLWAKPACWYYLDFLTHRSNYKSGKTRNEALSFLTARLFQILSSPWFGHPPAARRVFIY